MPRRPQVYLRPDTLETALDALAQANAAPLAGGTLLLTDDVDVQTVVDLQDLGLAFIDLMEHELHLGAMTRLSELMESSEIHGQQVALLRQALFLEGANTLRNAATLGGTIATRGENSLLLALLLVWNARLELKSQAGSDMQALADYLAADERPAGLITRVIIPWGNGQGTLEHVARTPADAPIVGVVGWKDAQGLRLAATGIQLRPVLLDAPMTHPGDFRGTADYRQAMLDVLRQRVVARLSGF